MTGVSYNPYGFDPKYTADVNYSATHTITEPYIPKVEGIALEAPMTPKPEYQKFQPGYTPYGFNPNVVSQSYSGAGSGGAISIIAGAGLVITAVPVIVGITMFVWRIFINKKILKGGRPGLLAYIFHWDLWPIWGVDYKANKAENIFYASE